MQWAALQAGAAPQITAALRQRAVALPRPQPLPSSTPRCAVLARGILDSYRRERGLPLPSDSAAPGAASSTLEKPQQGGLLGGLLGGLGQQQQQQQQQQRDPCVMNSSSSDDEAPCFVECVQKVVTLEQLQAALDDAGPSALVVVDFYKRSCGACKFIQPGFMKLCKAAALSHDGESAPPIVFLKHNVYDEDEEEVTPLAKKYNVRSVPRFIFFKGGEEVDNFATRDKSKVAAAIMQHAPPGVELGDWV